VKIGTRAIGPGEPPYVIAEIGVNHDGEIARALELTRAAAKAGADAVKLQYFETDRLLSKAAKLAAYQKAAGETDPVAMLRRLELSLNDMARVVDLAHELGIHAIVTVFSVELVKPASELGWDAYKSASPDVINRPLLEALAATGRPLIVSTGASTWDELRRASDWLSGIRGSGLAFLQCVSCYPAPESAIEMMRSVHEATGCGIGYSDHTPSVESGREAVLAGAEILEKHLTYSRAAIGPDHRASLDVEQFIEYVGALPDRVMTGAIDVSVEPRKRVLACERDVRVVARQSLTTTRDMKPGEIVAREDLAIKRPGTGIEPFRLDEVIGKRLARSVEADTPLVEDDLAN
jgi:sialic acid synthase SpsE